MSLERTSVESERTVVLVAYFLHLVGAIAGVTSIVGLILNYVRRHHYGGIYDSHHDWMISSFWWAILWIVIGCVLTLIFVGWAILFVVWIWYIYRHVRGLIALLNGEPIPS
jgi:uncharacterized membrane protein